MLKNTFLITTAIIIPHFLTHAATPLETEHTVLIPWTIEHTQQWELFEQEDSSVSFFRRNEFFENMQTLIQRDKNWQLLCNLLSEKIGAPALIFPGLGFAIIDKQSNELIGSIRFKPSSKKGYLGLSYGLKKSVRHQKLGLEIAALIPNLIHNYIGLPIMTLKQEYIQDMFFDVWHEQGKLNNPNFTLLLDMIDEIPIPLEGTAAWVDATNPASLAILMRHGMQPIEIECSKYYTLEGPHLFAFSIFLTYPTPAHNHSEFITVLVSDILSRDQNRIDASKTLLKNIFSIPADWMYLALNREEKAHLKLVQLTMSTATSLSEIYTKTVYKNPSCFL